MAEDARKTYTVRLPEWVAARIETQASTAGIAPTTLIQSCLIRQFGDPKPGANDAPGTQPQPVVIGAKVEAVKKIAEQLGQMAGERHNQLLFEIVKTRSALFHALDRSVGAAAVDEIIEASEKAGRQYLDRLVTPNGTKP